MKRLIALLLLLSTNAVWAQDAALIERLQKGGANIFFRHAMTPGKDPKYNPTGERPNDCSSTSRQLTDEGREQSRIIGVTMRNLEIPIGQVYASGFCRCEETARLAFGEATVADWMLVRPGMFQPQLDKELRSVPSAGFFTRTPTGKNNIYVGHAVTFSPGVLAGDFEGLSPRINLEEGEAAVIEPGSPPKVLGRIKFY